MNEKHYPDQYLHITHCASGVETVVPLLDTDLLDLKTLVEKWIASEFYGEVSLDGKLQRKRDGEYYAKIMTDGRPPESAVCWDGAGFYLK